MRKPVQVQENEKEKDKDEGKEKSESCYLSSALGHDRGLRVRFAIV